MPLTPQNFDFSSTESERSTPKNEVDQSDHNTESPAHSELMILNQTSLSNLVVSGHHDPFETYPCDLPKEFVSPVLDQSEWFCSDSLSGRKVEGLEAALTFPSQSMASCL